jgi:hypothetical protein
VAHTDRGSQYTSAAYTQVLDDHNVLASVGSVGVAYDNAMAESFVDSFKTELIADRVWRSRAQLELIVVEYISWFNHVRLHESLGDIPPAEFEAVHHPERHTTPSGASPNDGAETLTHSDNNTQTTTSRTTYKPSLRETRSGSEVAAVMTWNSAIRLRRPLADSAVRRR